MSQKKKNTALFIDGENISCKKVSAIMDAAQQQGILFSGRVYGLQKDNSTRMWSDKAREYGIADIRLFGGPEKNKVDRKIQKDVRREITLHKNVDIVCVATSDKSYTDTIRELRAQGKRVVGIGEGKAPEKLRNACSVFIEI